MVMQCLCRLELMGLYKDPVRLAVNYMAQVFDKFKCHSVIHICIGLRIVFALSMSKQKE